MKARKFIPSAVAVAFFLRVFVLATSAAPPAGYKLAWSDEFAGATLDTNKWSYYDLGSRHAAVNVADAVTVSNGCLVITSYTESGIHHAGMISTRGRFEAVHGYWEARIKFADAPGEWSAFWLQSPTLARPLGDPGKAGVEIDICEHRVTEKKGDAIADRVQHTLHWDGYGEHHQQRAFLTPPLGLEQGFHIYGCEVTAAGYKYFVDGKQTWTTNAAASNAKEFALLSSEISTNRWAGTVPTSGYGDRDKSQVKMSVDYVRYYQPQN